MNEPTSYLGNTGQPCKTRAQKITAKKICNLMAVPYEGNDMIVTDWIAISVVDVKGANHE